MLKSNNISKILLLYLNITNTKISHVKLSGTFNFMNILLVKLKHKLQASHLFLLCNDYSINISNHNYIFSCSHKLKVFCTENNPQRMNGMEILNLKSSSWQLFNRYSVLKSLMVDFSLDEYFGLYFLRKKLLLS